MAQRTRRPNAGNRLQSLLVEQTPMDDADAEFFAERDDDEDFDLEAEEERLRQERLQAARERAARASEGDESGGSGGGGGDDDDDDDSSSSGGSDIDGDDENFSSSTDDSDSDKDEQPQDAGEKELVKEQRQRMREQRVAERNKIFRIKRRAPPGDAPQAPKPKKKRLFNSEDILLDKGRHSERQSALRNKKHLIEQMREAEERRAQYVPPKRAIAPKLTQEQRLEEAKKTELRNLSSLNKFVELEEERKLQQRLAMISRRPKLTHFIRFHSAQYLAPPKLVEVVSKEIKSEDDTGEEHGSQKHTRLGTPAVGSQDNSNGANGNHANANDAKGNDANASDANANDANANDANANDVNANVVNANDVNGNDAKGNDVNGNDVNGNDVNGNDANGIGGSGSHGVKVEVDSLKQPRAQPNGQVTEGAAGSINHAAQQPSSEVCGQVPAGEKPAQLRTLRKERSSEASSKEPEQSTPGRAAAQPLDDRKAEQIPYERASDRPQSAGDSPDLTGEQANAKVELGASSAAEPGNAEPGNAEPGNAAPGNAAPGNAEPGAPASAAVPAPSPQPNHTGRPNHDGEPRATSAAGATSELVIKEEAHVDATGDQNADGDAEETHVEPRELVHGPAHLRTYNFLTLHEFADTHINKFSIRSIVLGPVASAHQAQPLKRMCPFSGMEARYRDPSTDVAYRDLETNQLIKLVQANKLCWSKEMGGVFLSSGRPPRHAKGVPEGFA